ncbi:hypothetical protein BIU97_05385 [Curtobacterium sp. MCBA15_009]|uniref:DUF4064 domain-containing protein n=1 Tax=Curtobacterium sp. MCBA15_009 TaxID=1898737 RepID=UPI0008DD295C|nr:DUF4064 domain-containing protein [Curtobacterium sp. MCBA15_009]OII11341.1 hypothetical protein BIU97_05385 [Curtobacterium sp. MCBA15_009]
MTNDDRSNEDRAGDGRTPDWNGSPQQPAADAPRYGERTDAAPGSAPQYGEQQYGQPQYGQQHGQQQYGQQHDHGQQQYGQQQYAAAPTHDGGAPSWQGYEEPKAKKKTLGVVAFVLGLLSLVIGVIGGYLLGSGLVSGDVIDTLRQGADGSTLDQSEVQQQLLNDPAVRSQLVTAFAVIGVAALLGLWALVQGIVAAVTKRGRGWGIFAIVLAVVATIATFVVYIGVVAAAAAGAVS